MSAQVVHLPIAESQRPRVRAECEGGPRPCPWATCTEHLLHARLLGEGGDAISDEQAVELIEQMPETCALDVADREGASLITVGDIFGVTRERIRQIESAALDRLPKGSSRRQVLTQLLSDVREEPLRDVESPVSRGHGGYARPIVDREPTPAPEHLRHLPLVGHVNHAGERFWCGQLGAAVTTVLCITRHTATQKGSGNSRGGNTVIPLFRDCAGCTDGEALQARVEGRAPVALASPPSEVAARSIAWFGDEQDDEGSEPSPTAPEPPAAPVEPEGLPAAPAVLPTPSTSEETSMSPKAQDPLAPPCPVRGCTELRAGIRADTQEWLRDLCRVHRQRAHSLVREGRASRETAIAYLGDLAQASKAGASPKRTAAKKPAPKPSPTSATPRTTAAAAAARQPATPVRSAPERAVEVSDDTIQVTISLPSDVARAHRCALSVGGVSVLEQLVNAVLAVRP